MSTFAQKMSVTVYRLLTKETKLPFAENERKFAVFFPFSANKPKMPFSVSSVFRIFMYILKRQHINVALILAILPKMLSSKPKCMFIGTASGKPLLKIGTMFTVTILFHFIQLDCIRIFTPFGAFSPFRPQRVNIFLL
jgi:hypothetical protein